MGYQCQTCKFRSFAVSVLDEEQMCMLGENCTEVHFKKGDIIFKNGVGKIAYAWFGRKRANN